jgi:hypothetical protein
MYNKTLVILLSGRAGSGKSYCADLLIKNFKDMGLNVIKDSFARGIKEVAKKYIGWDGVKDEKGRTLLQNLGTEVGRAYNEDCWVEYMLSSLINTPNYPYDVIIVDDWRFPNEYEYFKDDPFYSIFKIRIIPIITTEYLLHECKNHISEHALSEDPSYYDVLYYNPFKVESTEKDIKELAEYIDSRQSKYQ